MTEATIYIDDEGSLCALHPGGRIEVIYRAMSARKRAETEQRMNDDPELQAYLHSFDHEVAAPPAPRAPGKEGT